MKGILESLFGLQNIKPSRQWVAALTILRGEDHKERLFSDCISQELQQLREGFSAFSCESARELAVLVVRSTSLEAMETEYD
ncbi:MAG: hypothetical protein KDD60_04170 [Bdellovibrionales bacterium]|nr:hypothetical protein [Bdellovibrionales bacterium]